MDKLLFFALAIGSAWLTWGLWNERQTYNDIETWPTVMAEVVSLEDYEEDWETEYGSKYKMYSMRLEYSYQVNGQMYSGNKLSSINDEMRWHSPDTMLKAVKPYFFDQGTSVRVAYHPDSPETSVAIVCDQSLESAPTHSWFFILLGGGFCVFATLIFIGSFLEPNHQQLEESYIQSLRTDA